MGKNEGRAPIRIEDGALVLGERRVPIRCGSVQYFRLGREDFRPALESARDAGLTMIETYVPWGVHEDARGQLDFGEVRPELDLGAFLDLAHELGLFVFLRPGPHINAELTFFGLPGRIVRDEALSARSARGTPVYLHLPPRMFPVPSFASGRFHEEASRWLTAVGTVAAPRMYPEGPIALVQVDNEPSLYFRNGAYEQDYSTEARVAFHRFLRARYASLPALRVAHGADYANFEDVEPPARFEAMTAKLTRHLDWAAFQESLITNAIRRFADTFRSVGLGSVPLVVNLPIGELGLPVDVDALTKSVDLVGLDYYHRAADLEEVARRSQLLAGASDLPFAPELGVGCPPFFPALSTDDSFYVALTALAFGLRGLNLYMWVERDRWIGAPIDPRGRPRPDAERWKRLLVALEEIGHERLERRADVAIVLPIEYRRLSRVTQLLSPLGPQLLAAITGDPTCGCRDDDLGLGDAIQTRWWADVEAVIAALRARGIPFDLLPSELEEAATKYRFLYSPSYALAGAERWEALRAAADGGAMVFYGPELPSVSDRGGSARFEPHAGFVRIDTRVRGFADALAGRLAAEGVRAPFPVQPSTVWTVEHTDEDGHARALFLVNPTAERVDASVAFDRPTRLRDPIEERGFDVTTSLELCVAPHSCRMFIFEEDVA